MKLSKDLEDKIKTAIEQAQTDENNVIAGILYTVLGAGLSPHEEDLKLLSDAVHMCNMALIVMSIKRIEESKRKIEQSKVQLN